jgi:hypothetical protein
MIHRRIILLSFVAAMLMFSSPAIARESRIVGGDGLVGDAAIASSIWRIGLCPITAGQDFGFHVAEAANSAWSGAFAQSAAFKIVSVPDTNPSALTPDDIMRLGQELGVDALLWGSVDQAKNRVNIWGNAQNPMHDVAVMISFKLYETQTGKLLWERILKKDRTVSASEAEGIVERFAGNIVTDMVEYLVSDGIRGRDLSLNSPPMVSCSVPMLVFRTSAIRLRGTVTDDFGIRDVSISCVGGEAIGQWTVDSASEFEIDAVLSQDDVTEDSLVIIAEDSQGRETHFDVPVYIDSSAIEGAISNITADSVFINIGSDAGVEVGMLFTVETSVEITDPSTGAVLGSSQLETGKIEVVSVEPLFASCKVIEGNIGDLQAGDRVY